MLGIQRWISHAPAFWELVFMGEEDRDTNHSNAVGNDRGKFRRPWLGEEGRKLPERHNWVISWGRSRVQGQDVQQILMSVGTVRTMWAGEK